MALRSSIIAWLALLAAIIAPGVSADDEGQVTDLASSAAEVDRALHDHWRHSGVTPAPVAGNVVLLRRVTLDLVGRVPTASEVQRLDNDKNARTESTLDKHAAAVEGLLESPDFAFHFGTVLDELIQGRQAGNEAFVDYLRQSLAARKSWESLFREIVAGAADAETNKSAALFVDKRVKDVDQLTVDTARAFFGVDISCARCHDHPLVPDWTQFHYYGLTAFLQRPGSDRGNSKETEADVKFLARDGQERTAAMMFLSGRKVEPPPSDGGGAAVPRVPSRRLQLVESALSDRQFFSRSIVNRLWEHFLGRGLVDPVDQMHSGNPAAIPELLDMLARDLATHGYDLRRTVRLIVLSRAYRASSEVVGAESPPAPQHFAIMRLRPLSPRQLAMSLLVATGDERFDQPGPLEKRLERLLQTKGIGRVQRLLELEAALPPLVASLDPRTANFQSSAREALFVSNGEPVRKLLAPDGQNLAARLAQQTDDRKMIEQAYAALLQRKPDEVEITQLQDYVKAGLRHEEDPSGTAGAGARGNRQVRRPVVLAEMIWAIVASTEFRFNH